MGLSFKANQENIPTSELTIFNKRYTVVQSCRGRFQKFFITPTQEVAEVQLCLRMLDWPIMLSILSCTINDLLVILLSVAKGWQSQKLGSFSICGIDEMQLGTRVRVFIKHFCGRVVSAVVPNTRGPGFVSCLQQFL